MGRIRPSKRESTAPEEGLPEEIGRKLVASVLDEDRFGRFRVLLSRHSKRAVTTFRERETTLSLLQFACLVGNVQAAEVLLGLGADKNISWNYSWRPGGWNHQELNWLPKKARLRFSANIPNVCELDSTLGIQPMHGAELSILHLAALANQVKMVGWLLQHKHLPVDVRAGGSGVTSLMAVATRRCSWMDSWEPEFAVHGCGHPDSPAEAPGHAVKSCHTLQPMFDVLLRMGADVNAVDTYGCNWLAAAAAAGDHGLWDALATDNRMAVIDIRSVHASRVLLRAAQYSCTAPGGRPEFFKKAVDFLQRLYLARAVPEALVRQLKEPAAHLVKDEVKGQIVEASHPLMVALEAHRHPTGSQIAVQLLDLGVSLDALRLGQEELWMPARRGFYVRNVLRAVQHMAQRGQSILVHGRLLMTVFYVCCLITYEGDALQLASEDFEDLVCLLHGEGLDFREPRWWPCTPWIQWPCQRPKWSPKHGNLPPASPLVCAIVLDCRPAVSALLNLLRSIGDTEFINRTGPDGELPLVAAASISSMETCELLVQAGAHVASTNKFGQCPFWACANRSDLHAEGRRVYGFLIQELYKLLKDHREAVMDFLHRRCVAAMTLVQYATFSGAYELAMFLAPTGMQMNHIYAGITPLRWVCSKADPGDKDNLVSCLTSRSNPALINALTEGNNEFGLTVLGQAVAQEEDTLVEKLVKVCRQEGLELAPLLECHTERSECHPPLFILVAHKNHGILATLFENGLQLTPELSAEHMLLPPEGQLPGGQTFRPDFARQSLPGVTESASLLMCAACVGNVTAIRQLLAAGVDAGEEPFPHNRWLRNALTAVIDFSNLAYRPGRRLGGDTPYCHAGEMGADQLACVVELLKARGGMTEDQMRRVLDAICRLSSPQTDMELLRLIFQKLAICCHCKLVGCWRKCAGCCSTFYCCVDCQAADWPAHQIKCRAHEL